MAHNLIRQWVGPHRPPSIIDCAGRPWLAVRVAANCERQVADEITAAGHIGYCPLGAKLVFWQGRKHLGKGHKKQFPVFSRYIFASPRPGTFITKRFSNRIESVLGDASGQLHIPPSAIQKINDLELAGHWDETLSWRERSPFKIGSPVKVTAGPLSGIFATIDAVTSESKIRLLVSLFGRPSAVEIDACQLELA